MELRTVACPFSFVIKKEFDIHVHTSTFIEKKPAILRLCIDEDYDARLGVIRAYAKDLISEIISWHFFWSRLLLISNAYHHDAFLT